MNCTRCNTPAAPHELIEGLCLKCTRAELEAARAIQRDAELAGRVKGMREAAEIATQGTCTECVHIDCDLCRQIAKRILSAADALEKGGE